MLRMDRVKDNYESPDREKPKKKMLRYKKIWGVEGLEPYEHKERKSGVNVLPYFSEAMVR